MPAFDPAGPAFLAAVIAAAVAAGLLAVLMRTPVARRVLDLPNHRSMHAAPIPRIGGLGVLAGLACGMAGGPGALPASVWAALALTAVVSALDDLRGLGAASRLVLHLAAAALVAVPAFGGWGVVAVGAGTLAIAWMVNLYNFMDGSDALAGTMGTVGFGACGLAAAAAGDAPLAVACAAIAGGCAGFLAWNLPPARLFMGDTGSTSLGLLAGAVAAIGVERGLWTPFLPAAIFLPFAFDATATLLDRARRGCRVWEAHREHAYQKLNLSGLGHRRTALAYGTLMVVNAAAMLAAQRLGAEAWGFALALAVHAALWFAVQRAWHRRAAATAAGR